MDAQNYLFLTQKWFILRKVKTHPKKFSKKTFISVLYATEQVSLAIGPAFLTGTKYIF